MNINIIVPSKLHTFGGGIEKWLQYFLEYSSDIKYVDSINIYGFKIADNEPKIYNKNYNENVKFHLTPYNQKKNGIINLINFHKFLFKSIKDKESIFLLIGSIHLLPCYFLFKNKKITWIRSKALGEQSLRKNKNSIKILKVIEYLSVNKSSFLIFNGYDTRDFYMDKYNIKKNIKVIPNAVNLNKFKNSSKLGREKLNICYTGRFIDAKGFDIFIKLSKLFSEEKNVFFNSYGFGDTSKYEMNYLVNKGKYTDDDIIEIYNENDVVLFLNKELNSGGISHSLLEAMACGVLIIAWDNTVHNQVLNYRNSILVAEGDVEGLFKILSSIKENKEKYYKLPEQAKKDVENYSIDNHISLFNEVIEEIL